MQEGEGRGVAAWEGGPAEQITAQVLLPALVWRAGEAAAAVRQEAAAALGLLLARGLLPPSSLLQLVGGARLLPTMVQVMLLSLRCPALARKALSGWQSVTNKRSYPAAPAPMSPLPSAPGGRLSGGDPPGGLRRPGAGAEHR